MFVVLERWDILRLRQRLALCVSFASPQQPCSTILRASWPGTSVVSWSVDIIYRVLQKARVAYSTLIFLEPGDGVVRDRTAVEAENDLHNMLSAHEEVFRVDVHVC